MSKGKQHRERCRHRHIYIEREGGGGERGREKEGKRRESRGKEWGKRRKEDQFSLPYEASYHKTLSIPISFLSHLCPQYAHHGTLISVVRRCSNRGLCLYEAERLHLLSQIAGGAAYLASCGLIHRNLSLRTCLLFTGGSVKISGLKYSRMYQLEEVYEEHARTGKLPYKVCLPSSLQIAFPDLVLSRFT